VNTRLWSLWAFLRPQIALQACLYALLGSLLSGAGPQPELHSLIALLALACVISFGFVSNDYADHEIDRRTKPERFLPSGRVSRSAARSLGLLLVGVVLTLSLALARSLQILLWLNLLLTAAYALRLKRTVLLGNLSIAYLNSSIILYGALLSAGANPRVWCVVAISLLYSLAQEVLYTVDDYRGDQQAGILTTAGYFGPPTTLALFRGLIVIAALSTLVPLWLGLASPLYLLLVLGCIILPISFWIWPRVSRGHAEDVRAACRAVKWVRLSSLAPLTALSVTF
jgi:geranylgeranylglycerol-phosphate geranylgeranyltransferase